MTRLTRLFVLLIVCTLPGAALAQSDRDDRSYLQSFLEDNLSDVGREVRITGFEGALSARATIQELTIADAAGVWLTLRGAVLDWDRAALLRGRLDITELTAKELLLPRKPDAAAAPEAPGVALPNLPAPEARPFALPDLPVSISIGKVSLDKVVLGEPLFGAAADVSLSGSAELSEGAGKAALTVKRIDGARGSLTLGGAFSNATRNLELSLVVSEAADGIAANLIGLPGRPSVDLGIAGAGAISNFSAGIGLDTDGVRRLGGEVTLQSSDTAGRTFAANINGDVRPLVLPQYHGFFGPEIRLSLRGARPDIGGVRLDELRLTSDAMTLGGQVELGADGWPLRIDVTGRIAADDGALVLLSLPGPETRVQDAMLLARYDAAAGDDWSLSLAVQSLERQGVAFERASLAGTGQLTQGNGTLIGALNGAFDLGLSGLALDDAALAQAAGQSLHGTIRVDMIEGAPLDLPEITLNGEDYALSGALSVRGLLDDLNLALSGRVDLSAKDLSRFAALAGHAIGGAATLGIAGDVEGLTGGFDLTIAGTANDLKSGVARLDPLITGASALAVAVRRDETGTVIDRLAITTPYSDISGSATLTSDTSTGRFTARLVDASRIDPGLTGPANLSGRFQQTGRDWTGQITATGPGNASARLDGSAVVDSGVIRSVAGQGNVTADSVSPYSGLVGRRLGGGIDLIAEGSADLMRGAFGGRLTGTGRDLTTGQPELDLLLRGESKLAASLRREPNGVFVFDRLDLSTARLIADVTGSLGPAKSRLRFNVDLPNIAVLAPDFSGPVAAEGVLSSAGADWTLDSRLTGPGGINAAIAGQVAETFDHANLSITGAGPLALINRYITPNLAAGRVGFELLLSGPLALNSLSGTARTDAATLALPGLRMALGDIAATARLAAGRAQIEAVANVSSGGRVSVSGPVTLAAPFPADLSVRLGQIAISEPGIYQTTVDGQVSVRGALSGGAAISGALALGRVEIRVPETTGTAALALLGLTHKNEPAAVRQTRVRAGLIDAGGSPGRMASYPLDLVINAPARIFIRGRGLDAELGGALRLRGTTTDVVPDGRFDLIRGRLDILGKRLDLTEAVASLQGDFDPYFRIVAETESGGATIRFVIEGLVSAPTVTITSSPELPEDEILSRLLFGRELNKISALQALQIASAVNTLAGGGGSGIIDRLRENFGLDDLDVTTSETGETGVRVGKYITENLYSDVTVDSTGQSEINLNLSITPSVTARGRLRSDGNSGLGLFFEKDY